MTRTRADRAALVVLGACLALGGGSCAGEPVHEATAELGSPVLDPHSYSRPNEAAVRHLELDLEVDFAERKLRGSASYDIETAAGANEIVFDTRDLDVTSVQVAVAGETRDAAFELGDDQPHLGRPLRVDLPEGAERVKIDYSTHPQAAALQWLAPSQTASGKPFLLSQSQAILARTWVPCQDTPGVRMTYSATLRVPADLLALMSAENPTERTSDGVYRFEMPQSIPSYLLAIAVGDLEFRPLDERSGVYAEPPLIEAAAREFVEIPAMMTATEALYGPYRWGRYDLLVLPPSFPFGGMENPRLTFATPTIIAGDRSLVSLVAHELAHSWSGNLVTNATWDDFWLNEGTTTYLTYRIMEELYGAEYARMLEVLGRQDLEGTFEEFEPGSPDTHLKLDLAGRDPDDGMNDIAYEKGSALFSALEAEIGREAFDDFLREYFDHFAFRSLTTVDFIAYLDQNLFDAHPGAREAIDLDAWIYGPGLPESAPVPESSAFDEVDRQINRFAQGDAPADLNTENWTTHHWLHFLRNLPVTTTSSDLGALDSAFGFNASGNSEIQSAWFERAIAANHRAAYPALQDFLQRVGRRKFLKPLYTALAQTPEGLAWAREVYATARGGYHSVSTNTLDDILDWNPPSQ